VVEEYKKDEEAAREKAETLRQRYVRIKMLLLQHFIVDMYQGRDISREQVTNKSFTVSRRCPLLPLHVPLLSITCN